VQRAAARALRGVSVATVAGDSAADSEGFHPGSMAWINHGLTINKWPFYMEKIWENYDNPLEWTFLDTPKHGHTYYQNKH